MKTAGEGSSRERGRPRDPEADAAILQAALDLFIEGGVEGTSIEQVAKRAGVARLTVYRRWSSKEELIAQAIEAARTQIADPSDFEANDIALPHLIEHMITASIAPLTNPKVRALTAQLIGAGARHPSLLATYWEKYVIPRRQRALAVLQRAQHQGLLVEDTDVEVLVDMMVGAVMYRLLMQPGQLSAAEAQRFLMAVMHQAKLLPPR
jgi:AcrR family transcriptional regulator